ncbi:MULTISPECIES: DMT family transporter [Micromonospora]|uniref:DMT family transporter n=1 Tax=Micromonospora solifontis TaxID=2487138 RepID=A0ABX9WMS1_9ACTN|nr:MULTISPECIES: DMT family transporter [Micromonospora]NES15719.1 DMT family transporter [Micromonospora sp. PPF5-17B]NES36019.1 DMT family transporter [Micromonospora solifontis]NES56908.1 DMT family transporter [Micromonospora sp. PPF5-6]RNM00124.1 DMT family transporter [Micromonospora solifontis]
MRSRHAAFPLFAVLSWGVMFPVLASALTRVDALNLTTARYVLAAAVLLALLLAREGLAALRAGRRRTELVLLGVVGFAGFNVLTNLALGHAAPQQIALFAATTPLVTQLVRWARDGVRPQPALLGLSLVALVGVGLVITRGRLDGLGQFGPGGLLMIGAVVSWAVYTHGAGRFPEYSPLRYTTLTAVAGTLAMLAASAVADVAGLQHAPAAADLVAVAPQLAYAVLVAAVLAVLAWNTGVRRLGAADAALFMNLVPVTTFLVQTLRGYRPGAVELAGAALTIAALVAANLATRTRKPSAARPATAVIDRPAVVDPVAVIAR